jgi:UDP-N-acetylmuramoylalanine--D-glutamate ligase
LTLNEYLGALKGKRVAVIGAGISNTPLIEALLSASVDTTVRDKKTRTELGGTANRFEALGATLILGECYLENLDEDVIFRTPGLMPSNPALYKAAGRGAVLTSEMEAFFDVCPCKIIAVTGSDGKTTTTSIIAELLRNEGLTVHLGGNIGTPLLTKADSVGPEDFAVVELSSFQLITMKKSPDIAVVTNLAPNHLDIHSDMKEYIDAKRNIFMYQTSRDIAVFNYDNEYTRSYARHAPGEIMFFSSHEKIGNGFFLDSGTIYQAGNGLSEAVMQADDIWLPGLHNTENFMAAFAAASGLVSRGAMLRTARLFRGVKHRIEFVGELRGARYYNDSIASSPSRAIAGLRAFDKKVILIAGGKEKGISFEELGAEIVSRVKTLVLTGLTAERIRNAVVNAPGYRGEPEILMIDDFKEAVLASAKSAREGDIVLLSPACTSFDRFNNYEERGDCFREIVKSLGVAERA